MLKVGEFYKVDGLPWPYLNGIYLCVNAHNGELQNIKTKKHTFHKKAFVKMLRPLTKEEKLELL